MPKSTRRALLKAAALAPAPAFAQTPRRPNFLMVLTDDHSVPHAGCYGDKMIRTPNIDRFAAEGMRFDRAYTTAPQCSPSRASIFTGLSPQRICMTRLATPLPPEHRIFPEILSRNGYFTGVAGRWHHMDGRRVPRPWIGKIYDRHHLRTMNRRVDFVRTSAQGQMLEVINAFLDQKPKQKPFFLSFCFNDSHRRWDKNEFSAAYDPARIPVPAYLPDLPEVREDLTRYYGELTRADGNFGRILDLLEKRGLSENTIVVFMGDNGYAMPHGKGTLYQPGWHVPLIIRWPGRVKPGRVTGELVSGVDFAATFLEAAGIRPPAGTESHSFLNLLLGRPYQGRKCVFGSRGWHGNLDPIRSVCTNRYSLIYNCRPELPYRPISDFAGKPIWTAMKAAHQQGRLAPELSEAYFRPTRPVYELFDLRKDPGELHNLAGKPEYRDVEFELKSMLNEWMEATYDFLPPPFVASQDLDKDPL